MKLPKTYISDQVTAEYDGLAITLSNNLDAELYLALEDIDNLNAYVNRIKQAQEPPPPHD